eukprot:2751799-Prymnesium_polylepis.2
MHARFWAGKSQIRKCIETTRTQDGRYPKKKKKKETVLGCPGVGSLVRTVPCSSSSSSSVPLTGQ